MDKKKALRLGFLFVFLFTIPGSAIAGGLIPAKYAGEFMATGVGARALGMGGAFVAEARDVTAGYWNPAGLSALNYPQIIGMYAERFSGIVNYNYGAVAIPFRSDQSLGISLIRLGVDDIPVTALRNPRFQLGETYVDKNGVLVRNTPQVVRKINDAEYALYLTYSKRRSDQFAYGGNVKLVRKGVGDNSAWGIGFDVGVLYRPWRELSLGANFQDFTSTLLAWDTGRRELITPTLKAGLSYPVAVSFLSGTFTPVADVDTRFENRRFASQVHLGRVSMDFHFGLEYEFRKIAAIRLGSDAGYLAAGAGLRLPKLQLDYAFLSHDELGDTHRISLKLTIEEERFARR